jgi:peroxiredoxin
MTATLYLIGCVLASGQASPAAPQVRGDWVLAPRLARGQELVYRGQYQEEGTGGHLQFNRAYRIESRFFVLDTKPKEMDLAVLTVLKHRDDRSASGSGGPQLCSACLERARLDLRGRLIAEGAHAGVPLEGAPTLECGAFLELPGGHIAPEQTWEVTEAGRPVQVWRNTGSELVNGVLCLKLAGEQKSEDWDRPRADHVAWRRRDTVWVAPRLGFACRVERRIERREAAHEKPTQWSLLRYELDSSLQCPNSLAEDRRREILQALSFREQLGPYQADPTRYPTQLTVLLKKIEYHLENQAPTPYREAVVQVRRQVEAARRGETPLENPREAPEPAPSKAAVGELAPDFVATNLTGGASARPRNWIGKPVLLVFYSPTSPTAPEVLRFAHTLGAKNGNRLHVFGMSISTDTALVRKQHEDLAFPYPVFDGCGLRITYEVETTPKFMLLDSNNIVRGSWIGWGHETPLEIGEELRRWLAPTVHLPPPPVPGPLSPKR